VPRRLLALVLLVAVAFAGCSKKKDDDASSPSKATSTSASGASAAPSLQVTIVDTDANGTKAPDEATVAAVKKTVDGWLNDAVTKPLHSGQPAADLSPFFTAAAVERLADPAVRATLVDEGMPPATKAVTAELANAALSTVAGPDDVIALIGVRVDIKVRAVGPTIDVDVVHQGEFVLVPEGDGWKIDTFAVHTTRDSRP
jgi:hypothetical protein